MNENINQENKIKRIKRKREDENKNEENIFDARIKTPFGMIICGGSGSGKTYWLIQLLENRSSLIDQKFENIIYFYGQETDNIEYLKKIGVVCISGVPEDGDYSMFSSDNKNTHTLFIFDDLIETIANDKNITRLAMNKIHHEKISCIIISQNLYYKSKEMVNIVRQLHYIVIFSNNLDKTVINIFTAKYAPKDARKLYNQITKIFNDKPYSYIFIDGKPTTPKKARIRTDIFDKKQIMRIFHQ